MAAREADGYDGEDSGASKKTALRRLCGPARTALSPSTSTVTMLHLNGEDSPEEAVRVGGGRRRQSEMHIRVDTGVYGGWSVVEVVFS